MNFYISFFDISKPSLPLKKSKKCLYKLLLAAILIKLKARMLLPRESYDDEISTEEDPERELVSRLSEYMKVKRIAEFLQEGEKAGLGIFEKAGEDKLANQMVPQRNQSSPYTFSLPPKYISLRYNPCGGAVIPALDLSLLIIISGIVDGSLNI